MIALTAGGEGAVARLLAEPQDLLATMVLGNTFATAAMLAPAFWMALGAVLVFVTYKVARRVLFDLLRGRTTGDGKG